MIFVPDCFGYYNAFDKTCQNCSKMTSCIDCNSLTTDLNFDTSIDDFGIDYFGFDECY